MAIAVVYLHANACFWTFSQSRYWFTANIIESVFYFAVPIFFMISGAMLIDFNEKYDLKEYFSKRFFKTVLPYLIWSFIGLALQIYILNKIKITDINLIYILNGLITGRLVGVYWFFIPLFCTYLAIPLFALVPEDKRRNIFIYLCSLAFVLNILIPFIISVFNIKIQWSLSLAVSSGFLFYTLAGYLLHKYEIRKSYRIIIYLLSILGLMMHIAGTYELSMVAGEVIKTYKGYVNLPSTLYSIGVFVFIK
ncbi:Surface polysaccharide O-acyltransferase, integral membrane enzyme [Methanobrevibacter olleyae]|uniref:Surface polysaccharide O-acyltransferase, integral membrane enzyme n=1 Tax=Methanobrevibacter olleyae TaxID=294671 RepID=A0A1I4JK83_METOL|nr:acyltransferase [Methanobrevibacter olleyae]SFL66681.1 Surface polysaccharide O-acyltransferase, integral membrane enzyme [Methanobrevibacter olleyae]